MKEESAIVFHCTRDYVFALGAMLQGLAGHAVSCSRIIVYTDFRDDAVFDALRGICRGIEFIHYPREAFLREFGLDASKPNIRLYMNRYTHLCYVKFKILELLARFRHVLFMDLDMHVTANFDEVFSLDCDIAWKNGVPLLAKFSRSGLDAAGIPCLKDADRRTPAPNGGFILVNDTMPYEEAYAFARDLFCRYAEYFNSTIDEIVFAAAVLSMGLRLAVLDPEVYNTPPLQATARTKIVHFIGRETKPWSNAMFQRVFPGWIRDYRQFSGRTHCVSDKVKDWGQAGLTSCRLEFTYGGDQKFGMSCQIAPDRSIRCSLAFNAENYAAGAQSLHGLMECLRRAGQDGGRDPGALGPEDLPALFASLHSRLEQALAPEGPRSDPCSGIPPGAAPAQGS